MVRFASWEEHGGCRARRNGGGPGRGLLHSPRSEVMAAATVEAVTEGRGGLNLGDFIGTVPGVGILRREPDFILEVDV